MKSVKGAPAAARYLALITLLLGVTALYWQGLYGELVVDDLPNLQPLGDLATGAIDWRDVVFSNQAGPLGRPLAMASLVADLYLGGGATFQYKLTNLIIHLLCGVLLYLLSLQLYSVRGEVPPVQASWWALLTAAIWLTAPLFASTVLYVVQRMAQLAALFSLAGMLLYVYGRKTFDANPGRGRAFIIAAYVLAWPAAILSKESGALLPALLFLVEAYWFGFTAERADRRFLVTCHAIAFGVPTIIAGGWLLSHWSSIVASYQGRDFDMFERVLTQCRALWDYLRQLLIPDGLRMGVVHDDYVPSRGLFDPISTFFSVIAWVAVLVLLAMRADRQAIRWLSFGVSFYLTGHVLESTIFPLELYFEHRNYLPAVGVLIGVIYTTAVSIRCYPNLRVLIPVLVLLPVLYGFITFQRVAVWQSAESIARIAETSHPRSPRLQTALISLYTREGNLEKAISHLRTLAELDGGMNAAHGLHELAIYCALRRSPASSDLDLLRHSRRLPDSVYTNERLAALADALAFGGCKSVDFNEVREWLIEISNQTSTDWMMTFQMARIFEALANPNRAIELLDLADRIDPTRLEAGLIKLRILLALNDRDRAIEVLKSLGPSNRRPLRYQQEMLEAYKKSMNIPD